MTGATDISPQAFSLRDGIGRCLVAACVGATVLGAAVYAAEGRELSVSIGDLKAPGFAVQTLRARFSGAELRDLTLDIDRLTIAGRTVRKATLICPGAELSAERIGCTRGTLHAGETIPLSFSYVMSRRELLVELKPAADETWRIAGRFDGAAPSVEARFENARVGRLAPWLPADIPKLSAGRATGTLTMLGDALKARFDVNALAFADASGLHAGEKLVADIEADAVAKGDDWRWNARMTWRSGEVFWQPVFVAGKGQRLDLAATTSRGITNVTAGRLELPGIGAVAFSGRWNHATGAVAAYEATAARVRVSNLYEDIVKSLVQGTALSDMRAEGELGFHVTGSAGALTAAQLDISDVSFEDRQRRFALFGLNGRVPWRQSEETKGDLTVKGAEFLKIPVGNVRAPLRLRGMRVEIASMRVPLFDGAVVLRDFAAGKSNDGWRWRFSGDVVPISMAQLTSAFGLPPMQGSLSGAIPDVRYQRGTLKMDGALALRVFDGLVTASSVQLIEPLGRAPRLHADLEVKNMDLDLLTSKFDFGTITGRIDARVTGLELSGWQPVRFDARIASSPGTYPRKISQRAVQNLSALGGGGAAAAIQRSLLRFFDEFGYERLGISCRLESGICEMDGIERAPQGYVIVKGGGIPAISVIGYNRSVDWRELVARLTRITQDNVKPIIK